MTLYKLYEVSNKTFVNFQGVVLFFDHIDGAYSLCYDKHGHIVHLSATASVSLASTPSNISAPLWSVISKP